MTKRAKIEVIMADQLAPQFNSTFGHPIARTLNLDALASRWMRLAVLAGMSASRRGRLGLSAEAQAASEE